ncbi:MAG: prepilin-type N-terminal cleavage/methylation domain-containing protein [Aquificaceae bacterium]|nr:prepilin-type N-terminal cleavage/methylation domain-containing protein [Aquificaceae bacterium]
MDRKVRSGYTTMELLVVIAIISILAGFFVYSIMVQVARERLRAATTQLASDLNQAKLKSITTGGIWGIRVCSGSGQYKIFIDHDLNCQDAVSSCTADNTRVCMNNPTTTCSTDANCTGNTGPCVQRERLIPLPSRVLPEGDFYVVFDRRGYALNFSCGVGADSVSLRNAFNERRSIFVDSLGRVRYE